MTLLGKESLLEALDADMPHRLVITPMLDKDKQVGPGSIDLRLSSDFLSVRRAQGSGIDPSTDDEEAVSRMQERITVPLGSPFWLHPQQFALGATLEFIRMPSSLGAYVVGRSSWGRIGLIVATAVMVQPGYTGALTLELVNEGNSPIALYPGLRIAQLAVHELRTPTEAPYSAGAKYVAPIGPQATRLAWDKDEIDRMRALHESLSCLAE